MYQRLLYCLLSLFIVACSGGGNDSPALPKAPSHPTPGGRPLDWGELPCQVEESCNNPLLNLTERQVQGFLETRFSYQTYVPGSETANAFLCGLEVHEKWNETFSPAYQPNPKEMAEFNNFFQQVLDIQTCTIKEDYKTQMEFYFTQTKEYKNVVQ